MEVGSNKIYESEYKDYAWNMLKSGITPSDLKESLALKGLNVSVTTIYAFKSMMEAEIEEAERKEILNDANLTEDDRELRDTMKEAKKKLGSNTALVQNDAILVDLILQIFATRATNAPEAIAVTPQVAIQALNMKMKMLGEDYKGQTVWTENKLMEKRLEDFTQVVHSVVNPRDWQLIIEQLKELGWDDNN